MSKPLTREQADQVDLNLLRLAGVDPMIVLADGVRLDVGRLDQYAVLTVEIALPRGEAIRAIQSGAAGIAWPEPKGEA